MLLVKAKMLRSREGAAQGCPLAGRLYAVGIARLHKHAQPLPVLGQLEAREALLGMAAATQANTTAAE